MQTIESAIEEATDSIRSKVNGDHHRDKHRTGSRLRRGFGPVGIGIGGLILVMVVSVFVYRRMTRDSQQAVSSG